MLEIFLLVGLIKLLITTELPFLCSTLYTLAWAFLAMMFSVPILSVLVGSVIVFGVTSLYFWLLDRFQEGIAWWAIMLVGLAVLWLF